MRMDINGERKEDNKMKLNDLELNTEISIKWLGTKVFNKKDEKGNNTQDTFEVGTVLLNNGVFVNVPSFQVAKVKELRGNKTYTDAIKENRAYIIVREKERKSDKLKYRVAEFRVHKKLDDDLPF